MRHGIQDMNHRHLHKTIDGLQITNEGVSLDTPKCSEVLGFHPVRCPYGGTMTREMSDCDGNGCWMSSSSSSETAGAYTGLGRILNKQLELQIGF